MTAQLDITEQELAIVQGILQSILPNNSRVWVFGSRAKHTTRHHSDLDLAIEAPKALGKSTLMQLANAFEESHLPYTVDIVDLQQVEAYFKDIIDTQKIPFPLWDKVPALRFPEFEGEWSLKKLEDVTSWSSGGTPSKEKSDYWGGDIPWISASSMHVDQVFTSDLMISKEGLNNGSRLAKKGDILILVRGSMLFNRIPICVAMTDVSFNQDVKAIKSVSILFSSYLFYLLKSEEHKLLSLVVGTGIGAGKLETSELKGLRLRLPQIEEQQKIASFLTCIDDKLTKLRRKRELLNDFKRGLMQQLFSQSIRFKQDDGSEFPEWGQSEFRILVERVNTSYNSATECVEYPAVELESIGQGTGKILNIFNSFDQQSTKTLFKQGDVLFGKLRPYLRKFAKPNFDGVCSSEIWVLRGKKITNDFLFFVVQSNRFQKAVNIQSGSKMPRADWNTVADTVFLYPYLEEQQKIADCLSSFDAKIDAVAKQIQQLDTFKKGLLQKMFV